jgi:hypothetical protein
MPKSPEDQTYYTNKIKNSDLYKAFPVNLAENLGDVAVILLVALYSASRQPNVIFDNDIKNEITELLNTGNWDELAHKGLKWVQEISSPRDNTMSKSCYMRGSKCRQ